MGIFCPIPRTSHSDGLIGTLIDLSHLLDSLSSMCSNSFRFTYLTQTNGETIYVVMDHVRTMVESKKIEGGSDLQFADGWVLTVIESPEKVMDNAIEAPELY